MSFDGFVLRQCAALTVVVMLASFLSNQVTGFQDDRGAPACRPAGSIVKMPDLREASGLTVSRKVPGRLWAHNDSGEPDLFALDARGTITGRLRIPGATVEDWEAIAAGPCPAGSCLYVADIGDNGADRHRITVYRLSEPAEAETTVAAATVDRLDATYPDGPRDAETLLVTPDGRLLIVTKGEAGPVALYRFPAELRAGAQVQLERVGKPRESGESQRDDKFTDGAISPDGSWVALRTNHAVAFYRTSELLAGNWREARRVDLKSLGEPQGEAIAFGADNTLYLAGEGGGRGQPGTFARLTCVFGS